MHNPTPHLLTPNEVAKMFRVDPKTVTRWAKAGRLKYIWTVGGHRRYYRSEVEALMRGERPQDATQPEAVEQ